MVNALKTLERIKKFELDEQRRILVSKLDNLEKLQNKLKYLCEEYEREKAFVAANPTFCDFGIYTEQYLKKRRRLEKNIAAAEDEISQIRDVMADIFKEQKTYAIIDDIHQKAHQHELDMAEQKLLDEVGTNAYIKHHQTDN